MFLSNFSLHFFEIDASTKLDFYKQKRNLILGRVGAGLGNAGKTKTLHFVHFNSFLALKSLVVFSVNVLRTAECAGALRSSPSFYGPLIL